MELTYLSKDVFSLIQNLIEEFELDKAGFVKSKAFKDVIHSSFDMNDEIYSHVLQTLNLSRLFLRRDNLVFLGEIVYDELDALKSFRQKALFEKDSYLIREKVDKCMSNTHHLNNQLCGALLQDRSLLVSSIVLGQFLGLVLRCFDPYELKTFNTSSRKWRRKYGISKITLRLHIVNCYSTSGDWVDDLLSADTATGVPEVSCYSFDFMFSASGVSCTGVGKNLDHSLSMVRGMPSVVYDGKSKLN